MLLMKLRRLKVVGVRYASGGGTGGTGGTGGMAWVFSAELTADAFCKWNPWRLGFLLVLLSASVGVPGWVQG